MNKNKRIEQEQNEYIKRIRKAQAQRTNSKLDNRTKETTTGRRLQEAPNKRSGRHENVEEPVPPRPRSRSQSRWTKSELLEELGLTDASHPRDTLLCWLSQQPGLEYFRCALLPCSVLCAAVLASMR